MNEKVYCKNCAYGERGGLPRHRTNTCLFPVDNWFSPNTPRDGNCAEINDLNNCKEYKARIEQEDAS